MKASSVTASAIISLAQRIEDSSSVFYEGLAERWGEDKEMFLALAKAGRTRRW